jgi:hypothetical protein
MGRKASMAAGRSRMEPFPPDRNWTTKRKKAMPIQQERMR